MSAVSSFPRLADAPRPLTLSEFYWSVVRPLLIDRGRRPGTLKLYDQVACLWQQVMLAAKGCEPPLSLTTELVPIWEAAIKPGRRPRTQRKLSTHLQFIIDRAGPKSIRDPKHRDNAGLIEPPVVRKPKLTRPRAQRIFELAEISAFLAACEHATAPAIGDLPPPTFWRSAARVAYNLGLRRRTLLLLEWSWLDASGRWFTIPPEAMKCDDEHHAYVNAAALAALAPLRALGSPRVFPWPFTDSYLDKCRRAILAASTIPAEHRRGFGFHSIRKRANTEMLRINPAIAKLFMAHADLNTDYYADPALLAECCERLPQP